MPGLEFVTPLAEPVLERLLSDQQHLSEATVNELRDIAGRTHRLANKDNSDAELLAELSDRCAVEAVIEGLKLGEAQSGNPRSNSDNKKGAAPVGAAPFFFLESSVRLPLRAAG